MNVSDLDGSAASKSKKEIKPAPTPRAPSIISVDLSLTGDLQSEGEIQVDGVIKGDVKCSNLTVGDGGSIEGTVRAERTLVRGKILGEIQANSVTLMSTATVIGDITHEALTIEPGAYVEGHCRRAGGANQGREKGKGGAMKIDLVVNKGEASTG